MSPNPQKIEALRSCGTLNHHPEEVRHWAFYESDFFDPHDLVQLKYEMLRAVEVERRPIAQVAAEFGFSRPTVYEAREHFRQSGIEGLRPQKRGPRKPRKLTPEIVDYLRDRLSGSPELNGGALVLMVRERFGIILHPRTIEKALRKSVSPRTNNP